MDRICTCNRPKIFKMTFDGGRSGEYSISFCKKCHSETDREFLITEVELSESL